ncbi:hypothetical protein LPTSP2_38820 [Leptospira ellinghausenii]|uniref:Uncharacterized protein n=1 Tax=Leptospira ellinghausenii TaxID=1917822 RepID=A0A2P2DJ07_9LEPT|nr:hypothetical protein LPTSP2_38820 [Leptospira ellinghausenii]
MMLKFNFKISSFYPYWKKKKFLWFEKMVKEGVHSRKSAEIVDAWDEHLNEPGSFSMVQWLKENVG